jgi:hypothetical protein
MAGTLKHAEVSAPRTYRVTILMRHHARQLMQMREVVNHPRRQKFPQRHRSQRRMLPFSLQILRL